MGAYTAFADNHSEDFLRAIPKTDLHVHLDGSIRITTLIELAKEHEVSMVFGVYEKSCTHMLVVDCSLGLPYPDRVAILH